ncbi:MAG: hypothetical protein HKM94_09150 [Halobacteria archaeon]|nr:hypothetical protein [Halobacteria archaeon]
MIQKTDPEHNTGEAANEQQASPHEQMEEYGAGQIKARHGRINGWLLVVYVVLFVWALYYAYTYWGGLGPGLDY